MEKWFIINKFENYEKIKNKEEFTNFQKLLLANRDIVDDYKLSTFTNPVFENLHSPFLLKDMDKAVDILLESMRNNEKILIVGDYDQDGVAATVILHKGIGKVYDKIYYAIPNRIEDGYGINNSIVDNAFKDDIKLMITCDNGVAALDTIEYAKSKGIKVIVTDHHEIVVINDEEVLPVADAIVNPHQREDNYPFSEICGAMVAYKLIHAMQIKYGDILGLDKNFMIELSQFAALGTIADMMPIIDENRIITLVGLKELNKRENPGVKALLNCVNWDKDVSIYTVGFIIAPTVNSSGRLYTAKLGVELFLENDEKIVYEYAKTLVELNNERKKMTKEAVDIALQDIEDEKLYKNDIIVLYNEKIHESICGLVAGRIKERFNHPTIVLTKSADENVLKGSGRSIDAYNMFENLNGFRDYFVAFGGHAMACGLSIKHERLDDFVKTINQNSKLKEEDFFKELNLDYNLRFSQINYNLIEEKNFLKPFGFNFNEPIFATKNVKVIEAVVLGKDKNVVKFILENEGYKHQAISFDTEYIIDIYRDKYNIKSVEYIKNLENKFIDIAYKIDVNTFRDYTNIQLNLISMR